MPLNSSTSCSCRSFPALLTASNRNISRPAIARAPVGALPTDGSNAALPPGRKRALRRARRALTNTIQYNNTGLLRTTFSYQPTHLPGTGPAVKSYLPTTVLATFRIELRRSKKTKRRVRRRGGGALLAIVDQHDAYYVFEPRHVVRRITPTWEFPRVTRSQVRDRGLRQSPSETQLHLTPFLTDGPAWSRPFASRCLLHPIR